MNCHERELFDVGRHQAGLKYKTHVVGSHRLIGVTAYAATVYDQVVE